jgi:hypothetical protein
MTILFFTLRHLLRTSIRRATRDGIRADAEGDADNYAAE